MAQLRINPNRMELSRLKRRLTTARRGHKLLRDKRDEMMRRFIGMARQNLEVRAHVEAALQDALRQFAEARAAMPRESLEEALLYPARQMTAQTSEYAIMSVAVPRIEITDSGQPSLSYGLAQTSGALDAAIAGLADILPAMVELAALEKTVNRLADEIERTRRRVNALEFKTVPEMEQSIRAITMKLDENERGNLVRLMKIKEILRKRV